MMANRVIILSILFAHTLAAPNGCIESCIYGTSSGSSSSQAQHSFSSIHQKLQQSLEQLQQESQQHLQRLQQEENKSNLDYTRPGNWTEQNEYNTNDGHGKVYEEHGQVVANDGSKRMRYHKKNYSSSYNSGDVNAIHPSSFDSRISQNLAQDQQSQLLYGQNSNYNQHSANYDRRYTHSQRLEDLEDHHQVGSQVNPVSYDAQTANNNNHGQVYEEQGQYVTGPRRVHYYKKNYSSSYTSSNIPASITNIPINVATSPDNISSGGRSYIHSSIEQNRRESDNLNRELGQVLSPSGRAIDSNQQIHENLQVSEELSRVHNSGARYANSYNQETGRRDINYGQQASQNLYRSPSNINVSDRVLQTTNVQPAGVVYGPEKHNSERHVVYRSGSHQTIQAPQYVHVPIVGRNAPYQINERLTEQQRLEEFRRAEALKSSQTQGYMNSNIDQSTHTGYYNQPNSRSQVSQYHEEYSATSHTKGSILPHQTIDSSQVRHHHSRNQNQHSYVSQANQPSHNAAYTASSSKQFSTGAIGMDQVAGGASIGAIDLGQIAQGTDCTQSQTIEKEEYAANYHRFKRNSKNSEEYSPLSQYHQHTNTHTSLESSNKSAEKNLHQEHIRNNDLAQVPDGFKHKLKTNQYKSNEKHLNNPYTLLNKNDKHENFNQEVEGHHQLEELKIHPHPFKSDLSQQSIGFLELDKKTDYSHFPYTSSTGNQELDDLRKQTTVYHELEQKAQTPWDRTPMENLYKENKNQQTMETLEFGQQTQTPWDRFPKENHQIDNTNQRTIESLQFGQQILSPWDRIPVENHQRDNKNQQIVESLELGQVTQAPWGKISVENHQKDTNQQTVESLESGQQVQSPWDRIPVENHQNDNANQQTIESLQFGQQTQSSWGRIPVENHQKDNKNQQIVESLELGQVTQVPWDKISVENHQKDTNQQTVESLEFGQQAQSPWGRIPVENHQNANANQQTIESLQFGQQTQSPWDRIPVENHQKNNTNQQTVESLELGQITQAPWGKISVENHQKDTNQQTVESLESGQQAQSPWGRISVENHQNDNVNQQTIESLQFGQQTQSPWDRISVENHQKDNKNQQTVESLEFGQITQAPWGKISVEKHQKDTNQQTVESLEFGQQVQSPWGRIPLENHQKDNTNQQTVKSMQIGQQTQSPGGRIPVENHQKYNTNQQTVESLELGQMTQASWDRMPVENHDKENSNQQIIDDLILGQQAQAPWGRIPVENHQKDNINQQTVESLKFGQQAQEPWDRIPVENHHKEETSQQTIENLKQKQQTEAKWDRTTFDNLPKHNDQQNVLEIHQKQPDVIESSYVQPAPKPKLKPRPLTDNLQPGSELIQEVHRNFNSAAKDGDLVYDQNINQHSQNHYNYNVHLNNADQQ
ncbi:uncharacterized protein DDB_G0290301-like isoform X2 [Prorops nasuta]|uniref:uncharacterized protein DDB_G0290301-like isoform X2 n=2 Tax=Prorops nasuta TaxID=863751 RepID=UPI0034CF9FFC